MARKNVGDVADAASTTTAPEAVPEDTPTKTIFDLVEVNTASATEMKLACDDAVTRVRLSA